jgi:hypothetical protein
VKLFLLDFSIYIAKQRWHHFQHSGKTQTDNVFPFTAAIHG